MVKKVSEARVWVPVVPKSYSEDQYKRAYALIIVFYLNDIYSNNNYYKDFDKKDLYEKYSEYIETDKKALTYINNIRHELDEEMNINEEIKHLKDCRIRKMMGDDRHLFCYAFNDLFNLYDLDVIQNNIKSIIPLEDYSNCFTEELEKIITGNTRSR